MGTRSHDFPATLLLLFCYYNICSLTHDTKFYDHRNMTTLTHKMTTQTTHRLKKLPPRSRVNEIVLRSKRLYDQCTLPIYDLETGEYHSSRFAQAAAEMTLRLTKRWKLFAGLTVCLMLAFLRPAATTQDFGLHAAARRLAQVSAYTVDEKGDGRWTPVDEKGSIRS